MRYRGGGKIGGFDDDKPTLYGANGCWKLGEACQWLHVSRWPRRTITIDQMPAYVDTTIGNFGEIKPRISSQYPYGGVIRWQYSDDDGATWNEKPNNSDHVVNTAFGGQNDTTWGNLTLSNQWRNLSGIPQVRATATASLSGGSVSGVSITNPGVGYPASTTFTVLFEPLVAGSAGTRATGYATTNSSGQVTAVVVTNAGSGYGTNVPRIQIPTSSIPITDVDEGNPVDGRLWRVSVTAGLRSATSEYFDETDQKWKGRCEEWNDTIGVTFTQHPVSPSGDVVQGVGFAVSASATAIGINHGQSYNVQYRWQVGPDQEWWVTLQDTQYRQPSINFAPPVTGTTYLRCLAFVSYTDTDNGRTVYGRPDAVAYSNAIFLNVLAAE